jgi:hypothetical protein
MRSDRPFLQPARTPPIRLRVVTVADSEIGETWLIGKIVLWAEQLRSASEKYIGVWGKGGRKRANVGTLIMYQTFNACNSRPPSFCGYHRD